MKVFRTERERDLRFAEAERWRGEFGINYRSARQRSSCRRWSRTSRRCWSARCTGPIRWRRSIRRRLALAYLQLFEKLGGRFVQGNAATPASRRHGLARAHCARARSRRATRSSRSVPGPTCVTRALGYDLPLAVKRGYHMHYRAAGDAGLNHPMLDTERGYFLAPMRRGIRLTTGAEFALRDAIKTPVQLGRAEPIARELFPLAERLDTEPWMGARPCTPDMLPIIGRAPRHANLWFAFGHAHHGLTLGPVTGRLIAEMVTRREAVRRSGALPRRSLLEQRLQLDRGRLEVAARIEDVRAEAQVLAARVGLHLALAQLAREHLRAGMLERHERAVLVAGAFERRQQRGQELLLLEVVLADALDAELERELEAGERLDRREHRRRGFEPGVAARRRTRGGSGRA